MAAVAPRPVHVQPCNWSRVQDEAARSFVAPSPWLISLLSGTGIAAEGTTLHGRKYSLFAAVAAHPLAIAFAQKIQKTRCQYRDSDTSQSRPWLPHLRRRTHFLIGNQGAVKTAVMRQRDTVSARPTRLTLRTRRITRAV